MNRQLVHEHIMLSRAELAEIIMKAKGFSPTEYEVVNLDIRSTSLRQIQPLYNGLWTDSQCPYDLFTLGLNKKDETSNN